MKLASYNIMSGGFDGYNHTAEMPERLGLLQDVITMLDADIVGLIDTFRWSDIFDDTKLRELFGYAHTYTIALNDARLQKLGHDNGLTLLSREEFLEVRTISLGERNAIYCKIEGTDGPISIFVVYLDDMSEDVRLNQTRALLGHCQPDEPTLIMGDFNTLSPTQSREGAEQFFSRNPALAKKFRPAVEDMYHARVVELLEARGFVDAGKWKREDTMPTPLFPAKVEAPFLRVDYCFASPNLSVSHLKAVQSSLIEQTSDHLPITFEIS